jgi:hypothetical protein
MYLHIGPVSSCQSPSAPPPAPRSALSPCPRPYLQFLNDLVIDEERDLVYISDTGAVGGIVVYDHKNNVARRWAGHPSLQTDSSCVRTHHD